VLARVLFLAAIPALSGCSNFPEPYAPPAQRQPFEGTQGSHTAQIVNMPEVGAESYFVQDIGARLENGAWRWTGKRPTVRVTPRSSASAYLIELDIPKVAFKETGPVTLSLYVNDHLLDRVQCDAPGHRQFEKPIPREWLSAGQDATLAAEIDKIYIPVEENEKRLGFILFRIGLIP
jgi:hypothetical protein